MAVESKEVLRDRINGVHPNASIRSALPGNIRDTLLTIVDSMVGVNESSVSATFPYVYNTADESKSLLHYEPSAAGELACAFAYQDSGSPPYVMSVWEAYSLTDMGSLNSSSFVSGVGFIVEGVHARWRLVCGANTDFWGAGIIADGEVTSQVARLERLIQAVSLVNGTLTGSGTFIVDSQIDSADTFLDLENVKFEAVFGYSGPMFQVDGGARSSDACRISLHTSGTPNGGWGTFDKAVGGAVVTFDTVANTVNHPAHGLAEGTVIRFRSSGSVAGGLSENSLYRVKTPTTDGYLIGALSDNATVDLTDASTGTVEVRYGGRRIVTISNASPAVVTDVAHGKSNGEKVYFTSSGGSLPTGITANQYYIVANKTDDTYELRQALDGTTVVNTTSAGSGTFTCAYGGELEWQNVNTNVTSFRIFSDNTGNCTYNLHPTYSGLGVLLEGNTEKNIFNIFGVGCDTIVTEGSTGGSADSNLITITGQRSRRLFTSGADNTSRVVLNFEGAIDLGQKVTLSDGVVVADPRVMIKNGKSSAVEGVVRTHNGALFMLVDRDGGSAADGSDTLHVGLRFSDNPYGTLLFARRVQRLTGRLYARNCHNGRHNSLEANAVTGAGTIGAPSVWLGQVYSGDFGVSLVGCDAREGLRIGDAVNNLYPRNWTMGDNQISMQTFNPRTGIFPTTANALVIEKMEGGGVPFSQIEGNISLEAGCQNVRIEVPASWVTRYSLTANAAATATIVLRGTLTSTQIFNKSWLRSGIDVIVESLSDYGGASASYHNGKWTVSGFPLVGTSAQFASLTSDLNDIFKAKGLVAYDSTRLLVAAGSAAADAWTYFDGSNSVTPVIQAATTALLARMSTAPSTARRNVYDKLYFDLDQAGLMSKIKLLYILGAHEEATALLNLMSTSYDLTKNGSPVFTANAGFTGTGNTADFLATGYNGTVTPEGVGQNDAHSGVFGLTNASSAAGEILGSSNGRMAIKIATGGSSYAKTTTSSNCAIATPAALPRHVMGNRVIAGSHTVWDNGVLANTTANASNGLPDATWILKGSAGATLGQAFAAHLGVGLTSNEILALYNALNKCYNGILATA